jgi:hypothetical protein
MKTFKVISDVDQIVTRTVELLVVATDEEDAQKKATSALGEYPEAVTNSHIKGICVVDQHFWIPKSVTFKKEQYYARDEEAPTPARDSDPDPDPDVA